MKLKEFLTQILPAAHFKTAGLETVLAASALNEIEMPDEVLTAHGQHYMTADRAINDPNVVKELKAKHWGHFADTIERDIKQIVAILPDDFKTKYYAIPETQVNGIYDRLKVVKEGVAHVSEKGTGEDAKQAAEKYRKLEKELRDQIKGLETAVETEKSNAQATIAREKTNYALRSKINDFFPKLDPNLFKQEAQKNFLVDSTINSLHSNFSLEIDKDNPSVINFRKKDGTDVYEGNTKVTLENYLEKQLEPYTVKNNGGNPPAKPSNGQPAPIKSNEGVMDAKARRLAAAGV